MLISQRAPSTLTFPILFACSSSHPILSRLQVVAIVVVVAIVFPSKPRKFSASHLDGAKNVTVIEFYSLELGCSFNSSQFLQFSSTYFVHECIYSEHIGVLKHLVDHDHPRFISSIFCVAFAGLTCSPIRCFCAVSTIYTI